jgi:hypothetical protein
MPEKYWRAMPTENSQMTVSRRYVEKPHQMMTHMMHKEVILNDLKPNPFRDFSRDPLDEKRVDDLMASIKEEGFWGGVICSNGYIVAGHHRVAAAKKAGEVKATLFVNDKLTPEDMLRIYARENLTQRVNYSNAMRGVVAGAVRYLAKTIMLGDPGFIVVTSRNPLDLAKIQGNLTSEKGLGVPTIYKFLKNVPGISEHAIRDELAELKASPDYPRIIKEVADEVIQESDAKLADLKRREQALTQQRQQPKPIAKAQATAQEIRRQQYFAQANDLQARLDKQMADQRAAALKAKATATKADTTVAIKTSLPPQPPPRLVKVASVENRRPTNSTMFPTTSNKWERYSLQELVDLKKEIETEISKRQQGQ